MADSLHVGVIGVEDGWSSNLLADAFEKRTGSRHLVDMDRITFDVEAGRVRHGDLDLSSLTGIVVKKIGAEYSHDLLDRLEILRFLKNTGVRIFSDPDSIMLAIDRLSCTVELRLGGIPLPPTVVTEDIAEAKRAIRRYGAAVLKPIFTSKARGMKVLHADDRLQDELERYQGAGNPVIYIQKLFDLPGRDLGIVFLGGEYLGSYTRVAGGRSWNTTTHSGGRYAPCEPGDELIDLAARAQSLFDLDFTSVDVAETEDGPIVFEVSAFGGFRGLLKATGIDAAAAFADYVMARIDSADRGTT